jgi:hypothetical protein
MRKLKEEEGLALGAIGIASLESVMALAGFS